MKINDDDIAGMFSDDPDAHVRSLPVMTREDLAGSAQACHDTFDHRDEPDMLTTDERRSVRLSLLDLGFERVITSADRGTGEYRETFRLGRNTVTLTWGPKTPIR